MLRSSIAVVLLAGVACSPVEGGRVMSGLSAGASWPADQLLPSFPAPAATLDLIVLSGHADDELVLFASLKGIVNAKQPRIFSYEGDAFAEGPHAWLDSLGLAYREVADPWELVGKYLAELDGLIVYDDAQPDTINLATTLAGAKKALIAAPSLVARLTAAPYDLPILLDLRGQFADKLSVYRRLYGDYWPTLTHRLAFGLNPIAVRAAVREYAVAVGAASVWLDPAVPEESALLEQFLGAMGPGAVWMGWWPDEAAGVTAASKHGIATVASDFSTNLTVHSGTPRAIAVKPLPPKPALQNKIYVAFILSDGDNLQFVEHLLRKLWNDPGRGKVPMGWTLSPAMVDAMPGALSFLWSTSTANDALVSGPSGYGYTYPNVWTNPADLDRFVAKTESYDERAGFRVVTIWNTITGGIDPDVGTSFARNAPSLLGVTAQNTGGGLTIYDGRLPGMALACNYCTGEPAMKDFIAMGAAGWNRAEPRFLFIQAQPWMNVTPTSFANVASSLGSDYVVVRPDHLFQLIREAKGLPLDPKPPSSVVDAGAVDATRDAGMRDADARDVGAADASAKEVVARDAAEDEVPGASRDGGARDARAVPHDHGGGCSCAVPHEPPPAALAVAALAFASAAARRRSRRCPAGRGSPCPRDRRTSDRP